MRIYNAVEEIIRKSIAEGDPENLSNKGKPIDLLTWLRTPEHLRMSFSILKNAGITPQEIDLKKSISDLKVEIKSLDKGRDKEARVELINKLNQVMATHNIKMEQFKKR